MNDSVTVAILAGGRSRRMGSDKSFVSLSGRPLIEHVVERVKMLALPTILITNDPERYQPINLPTFSDMMPDKGSLGGLYTVLYRAETSSTLCVACDMPFLNPALLEHLITLRGSYDAVVPLVEGRPQGLHAVYHKSCMPYMLDALEHDRLKISELLKEIQVCFVEEADLRRFDPEFDSFANINTRPELHQAEATARIAQRNRLICSPPDAPVVPNPAG